MDESDVKKADKKRDLSFFFRALIYGLIIVGIIHAFEPYIQKSAPAPDKNAISNLAAEMQFTTSNDVANWLRSSKKPTVLMVYASWCNYCKLTMPNMLSLWRDKQFEGKKLLFVSIDTSPTALATYTLSHNLIPMMGNPVIIRTGEPPFLPEVLQPLGANYGGGVPYIGFFAAGGKLVDEVYGFATKGTIQKALHSLDK